MLVAMCNACTNKYPADVLGLTNWKVQLPFANSSTGVITYISSGTNSAYEVSQPTLATYTHTETGTPNNFYVGCSTGSDYVVFKTPAVGVPTSGSKYARTELREMNGKYTTTWSAMDGLWHNMTVQHAVIAVPNTGKKATIAQVFRSETVNGVLYSGFLCEVQISSNKLTVMHNLWPASGSQVEYLVLSTSFTYNTYYTLKIAVRNQVIYFYLNDVYVGSFTGNAYTALYFKSGNYIQTASSSVSPTATNEYSEVWMKSISVVHSS